MTPGQQEPFGIRYALKVALLFILVSTVLKLASLTFTHTEPDEVVYWTLAQHLLASGDYSLQGSEVLELLSPVIYDRPLFHHPPLFPVLLIPFVAPVAVTGGSVTGVLTQSNPGRSAAIDTLAPANRHVTRCHARGTLKCPIAS